MWRIIFCGKLMSSPGEASALLGLSWLATEAARGPLGTRFNGAGPLRSSLAPLPQAEGYYARAQQK